MANQMGGQASRIAKLIDTCVELEEKRKNEKSETFLDGDLIAFEGKLPPLIHSIACVHCLRICVVKSTTIMINDIAQPSQCCDSSQREHSDLNHRGSVGWQAWTCSLPTTSCW